MKALIAAFSIYSKIPMPDIVWGGEDGENALCCLPLVGAAVGLIFFAASYLLSWMGAGSFFRGAVLASVPVLVTGGIHVDGFLDVCDARASYGDRQKKLEILKDPHLGAFAVIGGLVYFLLLAGAYGEMDRRGIWIACAGFALSRALTGFLAAVLPNARGNGMLASVSGKIRGKTARAAMIFATALSAAAMAAVDPWRGGLAAAAAAVVWLYCRHISKKEFGGITGDLAGWFLQLGELAIALALRCSA